MDENLLPKTWAPCALGELVKTIRGVSYAKEQASDKPKDGYIPILRATNIDQQLHFEDFVFVPKGQVSDEQMLRMGDIVIAASSGSKTVVGKAAQLSLDWDGSFGAFCMGIRPNSEIEPRFVGHFLQSHEYRHRISKLAAGSNINNLKRDHIESFPFRLAPLGEQRRISDKIDELLSDLDAGVATLERARANLKRYRAAVLKAAVEGKLTEQWRKAHPDVEHASKLLERILAERRKKWEEAQLAKFAAAGKAPPKGWKDKYTDPAKANTEGLSELPKGWCWTGLAQIAFFQNGRAFPSDQYSDEGVKLLRPGNLFSDGSVRWNEKNTRRMPKTWANEYPEYLVHGRELIMNLTAQSLKDEFLGRTCLTGDDECCLLNQRLARISPLKDISPRFLLFVLKSHLFRSFVNDLNTGSLIQHMFTTQLDEFVFPLPPRDEQSEIERLIDERLSVVDHSDNSVTMRIAQSGALRQAILKHAFEGKLVPQDSNDEPASVLLERIRAARDREVAGNGRGKKLKQRDHE